MTSRWYIDKRVERSIWIYTEWRNIIAEQYMAVLWRKNFGTRLIPKNYGDRSEGFYRRLIIMRFNNAVSPEKRDPELINKFRMEADGIFLFALEGLKRLMKNNYVFSETEVNRAELQQYREDSDSVLSFVKENCEINAKYHVSSTELFNAYLYQNNPDDTIKSELDKLIAEKVKIEARLKRAESTSNILNIGNLNKISLKLKKTLIESDKIEIRNYIQSSIDEINADDEEVTIKLKID